MRVSLPTNCDGIADLQGKLALSGGHTFATVRGGVATTTVDLKERRPNDAPATEQTIRPEIALARSCEFVKKILSAFV
jgi:hypothetical protein